MTAERRAEMETREWFCEKIEENKYGMYRAALSILRSPEDAQDAQSEAICAAWEKLDTLRDRDKFKPWIMRILQNECYKLCRERKNTISLLDDIPSPEGERTDLPLWQAVTSLPKDMRLPVVLFYYDGMSIREISAATGLTAAAVKTRSCRARKKLREKLTERSNEDEQ